MQAQKHVYQTQLQRCQDQIYDLITNRHVPRASDPGKCNIAVIIEKNTTPEEDEFYEYPYYIPRIRFYDSRDGSLPQKTNGLDHKIQIISSY